jgi:hypothetical protein
LTATEIPVPDTETDGHNPKSAPVILTGITESVSQLLGLMDVITGVLSPTIVCAEEEFGV